MAAALSDAVKQPLIYDDCEPDVFAASLQGVGLPEFVVEARVSMMQATKENRFASVSTSVMNLTGTPPEDALAFPQHTILASSLPEAS